MFPFRCHQIILRSCLTICAKKNGNLLESPVPIVIASSSSISTTKPQCKTLSHYELLGILPNATQTDIKAAYYKLSMIYHPDKNKGCEDAANKFRDICAAYEVLGNYRLKKLYDKGIIHSGGPNFAQPVREEEVEDDPQTKFYKSRMQNKTPQKTGQTPVYNFDEWAKSHYGSSFERKKDAKMRYEAKETDKKASKLELQKEILLFGIAVCTVAFVLVGYTESSYDTDVVPKKRRS